MPNIRNADFIEQSESIDGYSILLQESIWFKEEKLLWIKPKEDVIYICISRIEEPLLHTNLKI